MYSKLIWDDNELVLIFKLNEQGMLDAYDTPVDFRNKVTIRPLIGYVRG